MYKRLLTLSVIVLAALVALTCLGYHAVDKWAQGLEGARLGEFAEVAEQIRQDVKRKLDAFVRAEQERPYTDYLYYYVPDTVVSSEQPLPLLRSPLAEQIDNSFAYGYFQIEPDGNVVTPYYQDEQTDEAGSSELVLAAQQHLLNVRHNVLPIIGTRPEALAQALDLQGEEGIRRQTSRLSDDEQVNPVQQLKAAPARSKAYAIESLQQQVRKSQVLTQDRAIVSSNWSASPQPRRSAEESRARAEQPLPVTYDEAAESEQRQTELGDANRQLSYAPVELTRSQAEPHAQMATAPVDEENAGDTGVADTVQIRIEPFVPVVVPGGDGGPSVFGGQVFLLRHVQIEDRHLLQGFRLDETRLVREVEESAERFMREGMAFELPQRGRTGEALGRANEAVAYTALLDFGFGELVLDLTEINPGWITKRIGELQRVYLGIVAVVAGAVALALASLWRTMRAQVSLVRKKDEFISAVSHELRTPLTSIRMYAEMLENNWLTSKDKAAEYYKNMRQESERLSRLVENVLDFSRLQRSRKRYDFRLGDLNGCIREVVAVMQPYAAGQGFSIDTDLAPLGETAFDRDAVSQIVVNLLDNAVKYARAAVDKTIVVRTRSADGFTIIEVEDHGPGVPHRQRRKVFEEFYRHVDEVPAHAAQSTGTGLGLALVKRFAEAHHGSVEVLSARPHGSIFKVALAANA